MWRTFNLLFELLKVEQQRNFDTFYLERLLHSSWLLLVVAVREHISQALWRGLFIAAQKHLHIY